MYNQSNIILLFLVLFSSAGCSVSQTVNKTLSPPADTKWVNFEVKNPSQYTKPIPLEVRYISHECMKKRISGFDGSVVTEPSYCRFNWSTQQLCENMGLRRFFE
ncbi:hypothetical protein ENINMM105M2_22835 [Enterobacter intestinihominis]